MINPTPVKVNPSEIYGVVLKKQLTQKRNEVILSSNYKKTRVVQDQQTEQRMVSKRKSVIYNEITKSFKEV
jgi:hypothetical protein